MDPVGDQDRKDGRKWMDDCRDSKQVSQMVNRSVEEDLSEIREDKISRWQL